MLQAQQLSLNKKYASTKFNFWPLPRILKVDFEGRKYIFLCFLCRPCFCDLWERGKIKGEGENEYNGIFKGARWSGVGRRRIKRRRIRLRRGIGPGIICKDYEGDNYLKAGIRIKIWGLIRVDTSQYHNLYLYFYSRLCNSWWSSFMRLIFGPPRLLSKFWRSSSTAEFISSEPTTSLNPFTLIRSFI